MEDGCYIEGASGVDLFKVDHGAGITAISVHEKTRGWQSNSSSELLTRECAIHSADGILDRRALLMAEGTVSCTLQSNAVEGLATAGASKGIASVERKECDVEDQSCYSSPKTLVDDVNIFSSIRTDFSDNIFRLHDPRTFFGKQEEKYRQEVRQHQIQQWVLKHKFSQESLSSDCWPDKYPQITGGKELSNPESVQKLESGKVVDQYGRHGSCSTQFLDNGPPKMNFVEAGKKEAYYVSNDANTDDTGILYASEDVSKKRRKLMDSNKGLNQGFPYQAVAEPHEQPELVDFVERLIPSDEGNENEPTLSQWLSRPGRTVDRLECLHIFKQILEFVDLAHAQGVVLRNVRPSSFILSSLHRVSFLDSASSRSSSGPSEPSTGAASVQDTFLDTANLSEGTAAQNNARTLSSTMEPRNQGLQGAKGQPPTDRHRSRADIKHKILPSEQMQGSGSQRGGTVPTKSFSIGIQSDVKENSTMSSLRLLPNDEVQQDDGFPSRHIHHMEETWYASPEEMIDGTCSYASDIYSLGVLLFQLFCPFNSWEECLRLMSGLRHRILPPRLLSEQPKVAAFCLWMLHPDPDSRPKTSEVLQSEILYEAGEALAERQAALNIEEKEAETELLLDFLLRVQQQKEDLISRLRKDLTCLTSDVQEVERRRSFLQRPGIESAPLEDQDMPNKFLGSRLEEEEDAENARQNIDTESKVRGHWGFDLVRRQEEVRSKCARLMNNSDKLEQVYFSMRRKVQLQVCDSSSKIGRKKLDSGSASAGTAALEVDSGVQKNSGIGYTGTQERDSLGCFFDSLCKYARYRSFEVKATLWHGDLLNTANMVCSLSFDRDQEYFATAGVCKRIKVFECDSVLNKNVDIHYPVIEIVNRSMLSSICWNTYIKNHIASTDYDGVVQLWDASTGLALMQYKEHEKRAWSVDFCQTDPTKLASGSDDGSVKIWTINQEGSIGTIKTNANVCCVQFSSDTAHLIAFGSADYKIYCYDLRNTTIPWCTLVDHSKAVSYVKFLDAGTLVSASTDNTLKLWDLSRTSSAGGHFKTCTQTYTGHTNEKNFVGLSVMDGYIACGSETNAVFAYHKSLPMPMASHKFGGADPMSGQDTQEDSGQFVSSVCWRGKSQTLLAANSMGNIKMLEMV